MEALRRGLALAAIAAAAACSVPAAWAGDDRDEVRVRGACTGRSEAQLRLRTDDGRIRVEFELENGGPSTRWKIVVLHERRTAWRGSVRTGRRRSLRLRRTVADWFGTETVAVRASSRGGETCRASATI
ncbi:MAG: hypothetical protein M3322_03660 [Actinomycetota bacterium]|nr:hypothetical protein [Actinomycetota bacterium]